MKVKQCRECGVEFEPLGPAAVFCSMECRFPERECPTCHKTFRPGAITKRKSATYCSHRCGADARKVSYDRTATHRHRKYGITPEEQAVLLKNQNGVCRICEHPAEHLDHDEGGVRGYLCAKCNWGLGHFRDRPDLLEGAANYLRSASSVVAGRLRITENVLVELRDAVGVTKDQRAFANTVTTAGKQGIADQLLASPALTKPTHMAIGTGTGGTTALTTELDRNALTSKTRSGAIVTMVGTWAAGDGTGTITEAGIFDASSSGNMWTYASFAAIGKGALDSLVVTWALTIA